MRNLIASDRTARPVHVSTMSGKLAGIPAINTNTLSNEFCISMNAGKDNSICTKCYSVSMLSTFRKSCIPAFERNSETLSHGIIEDWQVPRFNAAYARFSGHGELVNDTHLRNLYKIAAANPQTTFALWTKRRNIVRQVDTDAVRPTNLILVYSNPTIDRPMMTPPLGFDRVFNNVSDDYDDTFNYNYDANNPQVNCVGKCMDCLLCYRKETTKVIVERVK